MNSQYPSDFSSCLCDGYDINDTIADNANESVNLRLISFDCSMIHLIAPKYSSNVMMDMNYDAAGVIFVDKDHIRNTFQIELDSSINEINTLNIDDPNIKFYVFDSTHQNSHVPSFNNEWNWQTPVESCDISYVIQPAHAMMDVNVNGDNLTINDEYSSENPMHYSVTDPWVGKNTSKCLLSDLEVRQTSLLKFDFVRHIAKETMGSTELVDIFNNANEMIYSIEVGGIKAWKYIQESLQKSNDRNPQTQLDLDHKTNITRSLFRQLITRNPKRFENPEGIIADHKIRKRMCGHPQPLPFIAGDILEFKFIVQCSDLLIPPSYPGGEMIEREVSTRTYKIKLCLVDGLGINGEYNVIPSRVVYPIGDECPHSEFTELEFNETVITKYYKMNNGVVPQTFHRVFAFMNVNSVGDTGLDVIVRELPENIIFSSNYQTIVLGTESYQINGISDAGMLTHNDIKYQIMRIRSESLTFLNFIKNVFLDSNNNFERPISMFIIK
jgi:hypothetical protein